MKKLPYIFILYSSALFSCEPEREYIKNTCHRTFYGQRFTTDAEREQCSECTLSRLEVYDTVAKEHVAHIAYNSSKCRIEYLRVDKKYRNKGIGTELTHRAVQDMRSNHNCKEISLISARRAEKFWEKIGAKSSKDFTYVFSDPTLNDSLEIFERLTHFYR